MCDLNTFVLTKRDDIDSIAELAFQAPHTVYKDDCDDLSLDNSTVPTTNYREECYIGLCMRV